MFAIINKIFNKKFFRKKNDTYSVIDSKTGEVVERKADISVCYALNAETYRKLGKYRQALKDISKAIKCDPENDMYYYTQALIYKDLKNKKAFECSIKRAIFLNPSYEKYKELLNGI